MGSNGHPIFPRTARFLVLADTMGVYFTGKHSDYYCGDTFYPSWATDGNLYSPWTEE